MVLLNRLCVSIACALVMALPVAYFGVFLLPVVVGLVEKKRKISSIF
jgi:hypothetical protein